MSDLISRQAAIEAVKALESDSFNFNNGLIASMNVIGELPSADPKPLTDEELNEAHNEGYDVGYWAGRRDYEQKWIPCSERLPEESDFVLMTIRRMDKNYNHEPFISIGYISWNQQAWWCIHDGDCKSHDVIVDAWKPLPEPYKAEEEASE